MTEAIKQGLFYVLDMESSLAESLAHRIVEMKQYQVFRRWDMNVDPEKELENYKDVLKGIIISGSGRNINSAKEAPPDVPAAVFAAGVPILAICYGLQYLAHAQGVPVVRCWDEPDLEKRTPKAAKNDKGEQGPVLFHRTDADSPLFHGLGRSFPVWMKHNWQVETAPPGWQLTGYTEKCPVAAFETGNIFALQFHPELGNSLCGKMILHNFFSLICKVQTPYF